MCSVDVTSHDPSDIVERLPAIAGLYRDVFAGPPWNEVYRCNGCKKEFGYDVGCDHVCCGATVVECYPVDETAVRIRDQLSRTNARISLATADDTSADIVGFSWGWEDSLREDVADRFSLKPGDVPMIRERLGWTPDDTFFYLSELGLLPDYRGRGLGKALYENVLEARDRVSSLNVLMRTSRMSPAFSIATRNVAFPMHICHDFSDDIGRVVLSSISPPMP